MAAHTAFEEALFLKKKSSQTLSSFFQYTTTQLRGANLQARAAGMRFAGAIKKHKHTHKTLLSNFDSVLQVAKSKKTVHMEERVLSSA